MYGRRQGADAAQFEVTRRRERAFLASASLPPKLRRPCASEPPAEILGGAQRSRRISTRKPQSTRTTRKSARTRRDYTPRPSRPVTLVTRAGLYPHFSQPTREVGHPAPQGYFPCRCGMQRLWLDFTVQPVEGTMRPLQLTTLLASLFLTFTPYLAGQQEVAEVVKHSSDAVVLIVISDSSGQETALGSGFLVSADGEIVTNYHVIKEAHSAIVKLSNGAFFPVKGVLASDADKDLAVIKVSGKNLPFLTLGDDDKLSIGDHVVAIGSPLGLEGTVSDGVVSAIRDVGNKKWIQTTAPVSHGNSGGPLLNMSNHVVGVITMGVNPELGQNLNFAAPSKEVMSLLVTAHQQATPFSSVTSVEGGSLAGGSIWTSMNSGKDYTVRHDGDFLYIDWANIPSEAQKVGAFQRGELKKAADGKWRGSTHAGIPCNYTRGLGAYARTYTNFCRIDLEIEIDLLSDRRIEGITSGFEKFDCRKCRPENTGQKPFTWIPK